MYWVLMQRDPNLSAGIPETVLLVQFRAHSGFQSSRIGGHIDCFYNVWAGEREFAGANVWEGGDEP